MKVVLATGIYPPDIGGPATYVRALAEEMKKRGMHVIVVTYGEPGTGVVVVGRSGGPLFRWWRYAKALKQHATDADVVLVFSLVSVGVPLWMCRKVWPLGCARGKSKLLLRLGGDFLWERYTDCGGSKGLREFYHGGRGVRFQVLGFRCMEWLLRQFDHVVFSTRFQEQIYEGYHRRLPRHSVIENALTPNTYHLSPHARHVPFRLLYLGRFVAFKNIRSLLCAMTELPGVTLTLVGEGPLLHFLEGNVRGLHLQERVAFHSKVTSRERDACFREHDLLIIPSVTEISPNVALEARAAGLPVLLTEETGLSEGSRQGMTIQELRTPERIRDAVREVMVNYEHMAEEAAKPPAGRSWGKICEEYLQLFDVMSSPSP